MPIRWYGANAPTLNPNMLILLVPEAGFELAPRGIKGRRLRFPLLALQSDHRRSDWGEQRPGLPHGLEREIHNKALTNIIAEPQFKAGDTFHLCVAALGNVQEAKVKPLEAIAFCIFNGPMNHGMSNWNIIWWRATITVAGQRQLG